MTAQQKLATQRLSLLQLAEALGNVSEACRHRGVSRSQFYEYKRAFQEQGFQGLLDRPPIPKSFPNETPKEVKAKIIAMSIEHPAWGQQRVSDQLQLEGISVSPATVRNLWLKEGLQTRYQRILRLEEQTHGKDVNLTEEQIRLLEKANPCFRERKVESPYPGYLLSQDTFMVGTMKGVGRIYQQTFIDTYAKVGFAKVYDKKTPLTAADLLNDRVVPFFDEYGIPVSRILTDRGTEYCGNHERHEYELYLAVEDIDHTRTKTKSPQTNGICERFHKTVLNEFYRVAFRKKLYTTLEEIQADLDAWLAQYNCERPHQGRWCFGKTPMETFLDSLDLAREKMLAA